MYDRKGFLISVEGIDGAGKSTQIRKLDEWFKSQGLESIVLKEPTSGVYGTEIYRLATTHSRPGPEEEVKLFMLDRQEDVEKNIVPALKQGKVVIMDRYYQSNMAYQGARGLNPEDIRAENERFSPVPDLVIVLDIDPAVSLSRIVNQRKSPLDSFEKEEYLRRVREIFLDIGRQPNGVIVDASVGPEKVHEAIVKVVREKLPSIFL